MSDVFITAENVSVRYPIELSGIQRSAFARMSGARGDMVVNALQDVSLNFEPGDRIGLIGRNGAGKSTLLKLLGGVLPPTQGSLVVSGSSMNMLTLGAGMDSNLSGLENIRLMCRYLRVPKSKWKQIEEDVVDFTDLGAFLAMPIRTYSAGMSLRLSFAVATAFPRDILIIDEIIGAGDAKFFEKARRRMDDFVARASILIMASHSPDIIKSFSTKCLFLERGRVVVTGAPDAVWDVYMQSIALAR